MEFVSWLGDEIAQGEHGIRAETSVGGERL